MKGTTRKTKHRWEDNIKIVRKGIGYEGVDLVKLAKDRVK